MQTWNGDNAQGLDASHWQGYIDWVQVRNSGRSFAYLKLTEGTTYTDDYFSPNLAGARNNGMLVGAYHFLRAGNAVDAASEAANFLNQYGKLDLDLPITLDVEADTNTVSAARAWLQKVEQALGERPIVYTYPSFIDGVIGSGLSDYALWYAFYNPAFTVPNDKGGWTSWEFMQYTEKGTVPGMRGNIDLNVFNGTEAQLRAKYGKSTLAAWVADTTINTWLEPSWNAHTDQEGRNYIHWLADEMRRAAGILPKPAGWAFKPDVANTIINTWLVPAWGKANSAGNTTDRNNAAWLADQLRLASGQNAQNGNIQWM